MNDLSEPADPTKFCGKGGATAMAFFVGSPAWFYCVRKPQHDGECVMSLSGIEEAELAGLPDEILRIKRTLEEAESTLEGRETRWNNLRTKARRAESARGT